ncbi:MAG TPA: DUF6133 family protein [Bacteroidales bacterium]|jgi:hypothetical protein|nr:DUF6133 family protein [Tissierellaceae bacterium]HSH50584.1 DUF6133 family protein [Bacteroidales bacterium]
MTNIINKSKAMYGKLSRKLRDKSGENYVDTGVKILIAVVIGALLLAGLYALFNTTIMPTLTERITEMFNYKGN